MQDHVDAAKQFNKKDKRVSMDLCGNVLRGWLMKPGTAIITTWKSRFFVH